MLDDHGWTPSNLARSYTDVCCIECQSDGQTTTQTLRSHICKTVNSWKKKIWYGIQPAKIIIHCEKIVCYLVNMIRISVLKKSFRTHALMELVL